ncbi:hypothetical protein BDW67DRAFT_158417 [Aspergillus spinulosporus]
MMASKLSLLTSTSFLERASSEASENRVYSTPSESSPPIVSPQEARVRDWEDQGRYSPGAVVASRLAGLAIRGDFHQLPDRSLHQPAFKPFLQTKDLLQNANLHGLHDMPDSDSSEFAKPLSPPLNNRAPSPTLAPSAESPSKDLETPVNTSRQHSISPQKTKSAHASAKVRNPGTGRSPTPPSAKVENLLAWSDSEITGHDPTDPDDDGYGINGIGFKPTAAIAWARSQKRKKQVAEWKSREAREARERRRERRVANNMDNLRTVQSGGIQKKVKFDV